ncbi:MAG: hypothetical protein GF350_01015, partial [Chitinivibrionales bacterium]|nr:hypothetical protein [Chitinivibrionales bacterium]
SHARMLNDVNGWFPDNMPVSHVDFSTNGITQDPASFHARGFRYAVEGAKEFVDLPGEWAASTDDGYVYYWPNATPIEDQVIVVPTMYRVFEIKGSSKSNLVKHVIVENMIISTSDYPRMGLSSKQTAEQPSKNSDHGNCEMEYMRHALVFVENAENIIIRHNKLLNAGVMGVILNNYAKHNIIYGNWIEGVNYVGVYLTAYCIQYGPFDYDNRFNEVVNNYIVDFGMLHDNGSAVQLYQSGCNEIAHNEILGRDGGRRYAISQKGHVWILGEAACHATPGCTEFMIRTHNNSFYFNDIADVMSTTRDVGAWESWNSGYEHGIINNCFHDMVEGADSHDPRRHCIYLDGVSHYTISRNVYYNIVNSVTWSAKSFSAQMEVNDTKAVTDKAAAEAAYKDHSHIDWEGIGLLTDFIWDTPQGRGDKPPLDFSIRYGDGDGLQAEFYNNLSLSGQPALVRYDSLINIIFGRSSVQLWHMDENGQMVDGIGIDSMSVRWTGKIVPLFSEEYTFYVVCHDGARLWIDNQQIIDNWRDGKREVHGTISLEAGKAYDLKMEYFKGPGGREKGVALRWQSASQHYRLVPQSQLYRPETSVASLPQGNVRPTAPFSTVQLNGRLHVLVHEKMPWSLRIMTPNGRIVHGSNGIAETSVSIPLSQYGTGIYLIRFTNGATAMRKKVAVF